jgi:hypothetical protein
MNDELLSNETMDRNIIYQLVDGRCWDVGKAAYTDKNIEDLYKEAMIVPLYSNGRPAGEDYLIRTLLFYQFPLGDLSNKVETSSDEIVSE